MLAHKRSSVSHYLTIMLPYSIEGVIIPDIAQYFSYSPIFSRGKTSIGCTAICSC
uniref:Uncharacterized protein n=1 Tax=Arundo donax TaxID=35708 RepID=A0A0A8Y238_ARUDO